jgi:ABC-type branched-subunit amino acid transport system ATPase component
MTEKRFSQRKNLSMRFGGVLAVDGVSFDVRRARCSR